MSSKRNSEEKTPRGSLSRRGFMRGVGIGSGALGSGVLSPEAQAQSTPGVAGPGPVPITLQINGKPHQLTVEPRVTLLDALRDHLDLHRRQARLRSRHLRRLHRHHERQGRLWLHRAGDRRPRQGHPNHRGPLRRDKYHPVIDGLRQQRRPAVRLLHAGFRDGRQGFPGQASQPHSRSRWRRAGRQSLPLRHLHGRPQSGLASGPRR